MFKSIFLPILIPLLLGVGFVVFFQKASQPVSSETFFLDECRKKVQQSPDKVELCQKVQDTYFRSKDAAQDFKPSRVGAPLLKIDSKIRFLSFYDYRFLAAATYCYFAHRKWFDPKKYSPTLFGKGASGFAILAREMESYHQWIQTSEGLLCKRKVESDLDVKGVHLQDYLKGYEALVAVNPLALVENRVSYESIIEESRKTVNHERVHVLHVSCKDVGEKAKRLWKSLPQKEIDELKVKLPIYDWNDPVVGEREYFAFLHEANPAVIEDQFPCQK